MEKEKTKQHPLQDSYDIDLQACSATDCTGLIPAPPRSEAELESYRELYPYDAVRSVKRKDER